VTSPSSRRCRCGATTGPFGEIKIFIPNGPVTSPLGSALSASGESQAEQAAHRLIAVLDEPEPVVEDIAFAVLADAAAIAHPYLDGWNQRTIEQRMGLTGSGAMAPKYWNSWPI
jgi:hypothetical protein